ncbi:MAG: serine/threonine-protein kinase [Gemmatimonadota bacterium]
MTGVGDPLSAIADDPALRGFSIVRELGGGGMSRLFVALDTRFDRHVVIKVLVPSEERTLSIDRFHREIAVATSLQHPNIVPILSAGELADGVTPFLVMPYVQGESLRDRLTRGPLSVRESVHIARDVARALAFAHQRGIVHRDIKPGNVLLSAGAAVVSDFGVAKALTSSRLTSAAAMGQERASNPRGIRGNRSLTAIGTSLGTPAYMAPEQAAADPDVDHRADIYALGIVLYEMLTGAPPFTGRSPQELLRAQLADQPPPIGGKRYDVPERLAWLIEQCLQKEAARRPQSAELLLQWLDDPAVRSGAVAVARRPRTRGQRLTRAALGAGAIVALAGGVWWTVRGDGVDTAADASPAGVAYQPETTPLWNRQLEIGPIAAIGRDAAATRVVEALPSEISTALVSVPGLRVGGLSPDRADAGGTTDSAPAPIGLTPARPVLRLEGSVQRENLQVRVLLRAVDTGVDSVLWSASFEGHADSLLALQGRVARGVTSALLQLSASRNARAPFDPP